MKNPLPSRLEDLLLSEKQRESLRKLREALEELSEIDYDKKLLREFFPGMADPRLLLKDGGIFVEDVSLDELRKRAEAMGLDIEPYGRKKKDIVAFLEEPLRIPKLGKPS